MYAYAGNNPVKYTDPDGRCQKPSPQIIVIIIIPAKSKAVEPTMFKQTMFTAQNGFTSEKGFGNKYSVTACNATAALNIFSMQYTKETGKALSLAEGYEILQNVPDKWISKENANVNDLAPALNSMINYLEKKLGKKVFAGRFGYSASWLGYKNGGKITESYFIEAVKSLAFDEHYVNEMSRNENGSTVFDTYDGKTKTKDNSDILKRNRADYYVPNEEGK